MRTSIATLWLCLALGSALGGCELVADFDRSKLAQAPDAGGSQAGSDGGAGDDAAAGAGGLDASGGTGGSTDDDSGTDDDAGQ